MDNELKALWLKRQRYVDREMPLNGFDTEDKAETRQIARDLLIDEFGWQARRNINKDALISMLLREVLDLWGKLIVQHAKNRGCWP